ncbi:MAG: hypothetical protein AAF587_12615 [Bacteroidota bacterium]
MKNTILLLILLGQASILSFAQGDFRPGYLIMLNGDTLHGKIDYKAPLLLHEFCLFKSASSSESRKYWPNQILGYRFQDDKFFVAKEFKGEKSFFEYLIKGKINMYYLHSETGGTYFLDKEDVDLQEIPYSENILSRDGSYYLKKSTEHFGFLHYNMQDDPTIQPKIYQIDKPSHKNLIRLAKTYHNNVCDDEECIIYEKADATISIQVEPVVGFGKVSLQTESINIDGGSFFEAGGYVHFRYNKNERLSIKLGLTRQFSNQEDRSWFKAPFHVNYTIPYRRIQPSASIGINFYPNGLNDRLLGLSHTNYLGLGVNTRISQKTWIHVQGNLDLLPVSYKFHNQDTPIRPVSRSVNIGLFIQL